MLTFPKNFLWGTATAAHQVEGQNFNSDWWDWEQQPGKIRNNDSSRVACDWWNGRYAEDFDRARELGMNTQRFSIEWARIEPRQGEFDAAAIAKYRAMLEALHARGMKPMVTLLHFSLPLWVAKQGGWENPNIVTWLARYTEFVVKALHDLCDFWVTLNEPNNAIAFGYVLGTFPPGKSNIGAALAVIETSVRAHAAMYRVLKRIQPDAQVGIAHSVRPFVPHRPHSPLDQWVTQILDRLLNRAIFHSLEQGRFLFPVARGRAFPEGKDTQDYLGLNYYYIETTRFNWRRPGELFRHPVLKPETLELQKLFSQVADIDPRGMELALESFAKHRKPIYITENGIFAADHDLQPRYLVSHLAAVHRAMQKGADVRGYYWWTLADNFEWAEGWDARFGLYQLDVESQTRTKRPAADVYARIIREQGIADDLIAKYGERSWSVVETQSNA